MACCEAHKRTWRFDNSEQTTASNILREIEGFTGNLYMSFNNVLHEGCVLNVVSSPTVVVSPSGITVGTVQPDNDLITLIIPLTITTVGSYQFIVTVQDLQDEIIIRRSNLVIESLTGN